MRLLSERREGVGGERGNKERKSKFSALSGVPSARILLKAEAPKILKETKLICFSSYLLVILQSEQKDLFLSHYSKGRSKEVQKKIGFSNSNTISSF